ncbi:MAG TPA: protein jag [Syntrophaceticus sp.]|jgi:spoIIIJ-associated protein|uniref:RNA-binding protein KhpB n=1 Tax=Syntrophaceticus schinkii TaxID=499207 RepID=A0A0B7MAJ0_9FIRM|nr:RNA-binding cell elongation regulator Jag/EloR [Syntrophaceticus schinkii]HHY29365.1 protein jag [Syntrophaceticus sp.]MDD2359584.1 protein jag [Syntrophaceticus schinkii]MDD4260731.1 protein jag [Syntrophaceticus schinkii]MDD4674770.1 protein jag [Syntrophaceticus schinkii]CEO87524.1 Protein jag [Syntrophaceticus schinkii]
MKSIVVDGSSVEEAVQNALKKLGVTREQVEVNVLEEGSRGLFGLIGGKQASVSVTLKVTPEQLIKDFLDEVIEAMGLETEYTVFLDDGYWYVDFTGKDVRFIIGRRGKTLNSLQMLTNMAVNRKLEERARIIIDAEGYRSRREQSLRRLAQKTAERVRRTKANVMLEPMTPQERRIIHLELQNNEWVSTTSRGDDPYRKVVICYKSRGA